MFSLSVRDVMQYEKFLTASSTTTVEEAAKVMARDNAGAILVVDDDELLGIFTNRDAVYRVIAQGLDPCVTTLGQAMTAHPRTVDSSRRFGWALHVMNVAQVGHLPVVEDGHPVGIVTTRKVFDPELEEFVAEASRRDYYTQQSQDG